MSTPYEEMSETSINSVAKPDSNLSNDSNKLGGIDAEDYATKEYVRKYHDNKEENLKKYIDEQDERKLNETKEYTNSMIRNQDFSDFAKGTDVQALKTKLEAELSEQATQQKNYTDTKVQGVVDDVNSNFNDVNNAITNLNNNQKSLFQSVSSGKTKIAGAITDKGITTSADSSFDTMATNIRNIKTTGGGGTGTDTSDATATAADITKGKTAYSKGQKIYGALELPSNYQQNEANPYPDKAEVELLYEPEAESLKQHNTNSSLFSITCDRRLSIKYLTDENAFQICDIDGNIMRDGNTGKILGKYTLEQLGIELNDDLEISDIKFSPMNTDEDQSGFDCKLAIAVRKKSSTITEETINSYYIYVYRFSTYGFAGKIYTENEVGKNYELANIQKIIAKTTYILSSCQIFFSDDDMNNFIIRAQNSENGKNFLFLIKLEKFVTAGAAYKELSNIELSSYYSFDRDGIRYINNKRLLIIDYDRWGSSQRTQTCIFVLDENGNTIGNVINAEWKMAITHDGLYAMKSDGKFYQMLVNYTTGEIAFKPITDVSVLNIWSLGEYYGGNTYNWPKLYFDMTGKYLIVKTYFSGNSGNGDNLLNIYYIDSYTQTENLKLIYSTKGEYAYSSNYMFTSDYKTFMEKINGKVILFYPTVSQKLKGIKYNGKMFYSYIYEPHMFTAEQEDVAIGKTFVGYDGIPQTGTMEVTN